MRLAVIDRKRCNPKICGDYPCMRFCPRNRSGDECVVLASDNKPIINEDICIGCGICPKKCPTHAITIINLPKEPKNMIHQFGKNTFRLYGLPIPIKGQVTGLLGANGIGKSTALKILSGHIQPNLGNYENPPDWGKIIAMFRGTELQNYLKSLNEKGVKTVYKPQQVDQIPKLVKGKVKNLIKDERNILKIITKQLNIDYLSDKDIAELSGGELQRVAIAIAICKEADVYYFDEPSSFLDVKQRVGVAKTIRELAKGKAVVVVEHDLATLDLLADNIHVVYGSPGVYGVISTPYAARRGINSYLGGYIREDNVRFRDTELKFSDYGSRFKGSVKLVEYPSVEKKFKAFNLTVDKGYLYAGEILGVFGANALGKTTFAKILAGQLKPDNCKLDQNMKISYKPQYLHSDFIGTVEELLCSAARDYGTTEHKAEIIRPLELENLLDESVQNLSGGEMQRVAIAVCLSQDTDLYLLDEPSAYLDVEQRVKFAKLLRKFIETKRKTAMVIDHDILMLDYISDRAMIFLGKSGEKGHASSPAKIKQSMNQFLKDLNITFRTDPESGRPRANKHESQKDREQKQSGDYYHTK